MGLNTFTLSSIIYHLSYTDTGAGRKWYRWAHSLFEGLLRHLLLQGLWVWLPSVLVHPRLTTTEKHLENNNVFYLQYYKR